MSEKKHLFLIGFMGTGKSSVARALSSRLGIRQIEMDSAIEESEGMSISEIFRQKGEPYFRDLETAFLSGLTEHQPRAVVSCGGGVPLREENRARMREIGHVILLLATPETVFSRAGGDAARPNIASLKSPAAVGELMKKREAAYEEAADYCVQTDGHGIEEICDEICTYLEKKSNQIDP